MSIRETIEGIITLAFDMDLSEKCQQCVAQDNCVECFTDDILEALKATVLEMENPFILKPGQIVTQDLTSQLRRKSNEAAWDLCRAATLALLTEGQVSDVLRQHEGEGTPEPPEA